MEKAFSLPKLEGMLAARIQADVSAYGESGICRVYRYPEGTLAVTYGQGVYCGETSDELRQSTPLLCSSLLCEESIAAAFLKPYRSYCVMEPETVEIPTNSPDPFEDYFLLHHLQELKVDRVSYYADRSHRTRHNLMQSYAFYEKGEPICFGGYGFLGEQSAEISDIFTRPRHRNQGWATEMLRFLVQHMEKPTYLLCREELRAFYEKAGFGVRGRAALISF